MIIPPLKLNENKKRKVKSNVKRDLTLPSSIRKSSHKTKLLGHNFLEHHDVENYIHLEGTILLRNRLRTMNFQTGFILFPGLPSKTTAE